MMNMKDENYTNKCASKADKIHKLRTYIERTILSKYLKI